MKNNRRKLLKAVTLGGGGVTAFNLPVYWSKPIVESVVLPAHAQTTGPTPVSLRQAATSSAAPVNITLHEQGVPGLYASDPELLQRLMDVYLPKAHADPGIAYPADAQVFGSENANGKWVFEVFLDFGDLCEASESSAQQPSVCGADVRNDDHPDLLDAFVREAHADPVPIYTFQSLFVTEPLDVGDNVSPLFITSGCDFGVIEFKFVALNGDSPKVDILGSEIDLFPGNKPFGSPICDELLVPSDRNIKNSFHAVDEQEILERVAQMPIEYWNYTDRQPGVRHIGPMAQDFHSAFSVGDSDRHIHAVDANGVNLASIKALYKRLQEKDDKITALEADLKAIKEKLGLPS